MAKHKAARGLVALFVGTKKGAFMLRSDKSRRQWKLVGPWYLGNKVHHVVLDPRDGRTLLMAARTGHLGPIVLRSEDFGKTWKESEKSPAFPKAREGEKGLVVDHVFWVTPSTAEEPGVFYAGSSPQGLFRSEDGGRTWEGVSGFNENPMRRAWVGGDQDGTPDGPKMHSIIVDPRDPKHLYIGMSSGGVFESLDRGASFRPLNRGVAADFLPDPSVEFGHDPHCVRLHPAQPDRLYQQNHCGIYRLDRPSDTWERIGKNMPKKVGDVGFPMVVHPRDPDTAWVFPMDGTAVWPRTSPDGKPAAYVTRDAGENWKRLDRGLPKSQAWFTVFRQAMTADQHDPVGIYFGNTAGEIWGSVNEGKRFKKLAEYLPHIYSVEAAELGR